MLVGRHDRLLQPERQQMLLRDALLAVRELIAGGGQRDLRVVVRRDVLEGPAQATTVPAASTTGSANTRIWRILWSSGWTTRNVTVSASRCSGRVCLKRLTTGLSAAIT
jgi:hypothetical protein